MLHRVCPKPLSLSCHCQSSCCQVIPRNCLWARYLTSNRQRNLRMIILKTFSCSPQLATIPWTAFFSQDDLFFLLDLKSKLRTLPFWKTLEPTTQASLQIFAWSSYRSTLRWLFLSGTDHVTGITTLSVLWTSMACLKWRRGSSSRSCSCTCSWASIWLALLPPVEAWWLAAHLVVDLLRRAAAREGGLSSGILLFINLW